MALTREAVTNLIERFGAGQYNNEIRSQVMHALVQLGTFLDRGTPSAPSGPVDPPPNQPTAPVEALPLSNDTKIDTAPPTENVINQSPVTADETAVEPTDGTRFADSDGRTAPNAVPAGSLPPELDRPDDENIHDPDEDTEPEPDITGLSDDLSPAVTPRKKPKKPNK